MQKATARQLKEHNQRLVLRAIYIGQATTRATIAEQTGLTRPTVSQIVAELLEAGLVREEGPGESRGGKPPMLLSFADDAYYIIGMHLEGRTIYGAVMDLRGRILDRVADTPHYAGVESILEGFYQTLDRLRAEVPRPLLGVGVSVPGLVDHVNGVVRYMAYLDWWNVSLGKWLSERLGEDIPIYVDNDTNIAALGECVFGAGGRASNMAIVMVSTGVGAGFILNGEIYHGAKGGAGEIGHMPVADTDVPCICGRRRCLEAVASGWALVRQAQDAARAHPESALHAQTPDEITFEHVRRAVQVGDKVALDLVREVGRHLGRVVAVLISTMNPQRVIIGGLATELGEPLFESLRRTVNEHTLAVLAQDTEILPASLGSDAFLLGAAAQVLKGELGVL